MYIVMSGLFEGIHLQLTNEGTIKNQFKFIIILVTFLLN